MSYVCNLALETEWKNSVSGLFGRRFTRLGKISKIGSKTQSERN
jgi:hypothetical protein